jgi:hypothetical protein
MPTRRDNRPEMNLAAFSGLVHGDRIDTVHIQPGKPRQNAHVESLDGWLRINS